MNKNDQSFIKYPDYISAHNICTIVLNNSYLYLGSYEHDKVTTGRIYKYSVSPYKKIENIRTFEKLQNISEMEITKNFQKTHEIETTGTFHLLKYNNFIIALNKQDICFYNEKLETLKIIKTKHMNISGEIYLIRKEPMLLITTDTGEAVIYKFEKKNLLEHVLYMKKNITNGIIWTVFKYNGSLFFGTDNCEILIFDFDNFINLYETHPIRILMETAPTFFNVINEDLFVLTYNSFYKFETNTNNFKKVEVQGGWRFHQLNCNKECFFVLLNDSGCYLINTETFKVEKHFKTDSHCYAFAQIENILCFSAFYCQKVYLVEI
ncbi:hypothetical protein CDIK_0181 [Cucumispora dikerogammari]|nr:hypothetical protein CDIK_0181 [Cucumispora dikerogammari]